MSFADARIGRPDPEGHPGSGRLHERSVSCVHWRHKSGRGYQKAGLRPACREWDAGTSLR